MKRKISLLILFIFTALFILAVFYKETDSNKTGKKQDTIVETTQISNTENAYKSIEYKEVIEEVVEEQDPYEIAIQEMQEKLSEIEKIDNRMEWFISYKEIVKEYSEVIDPQETIYDYYTDEEINLICRVVETETYQASFTAKVNVANVVLNRIVYGDEFGETVNEVVTKDNQFAYGRKKISDDTLLAVEYAFMFGDTTNGALYFHSNKKTKTFCGKKYIFTDDAGHHFY